MSKKLAPYAFIISIMLVLSTLIPSQVFAESELSLLWEKEFDGQFYNEVATTSTSDTLMTTYKISQSANYGQIYTYDFMKLDSRGNIISTKRLKNGKPKIFEYNGQGYIAFFDKSTSRFELYNEDFQLLHSKAVSAKGFDNWISVSGDIIALTLDSKNVIYYSLKTFEEIPASQIPIERYILVDSYNEQTNDINYSINGLTFSNTIVEEIPLDQSQLNGMNLWSGYSGTIDKYNGYFYLPINADNSEESYNMLYKIDMMGKIVDEHVVGIDGNGSVTINNKMIIASDQYYVYDLDSFKLIDQYETKGVFPNIGKINNDLYYYQSGNEIIVADYIGTKYTIPGSLYLSETSGKFFKGSNGQTNNIYSTATGSLILTETNYQLGVHNNTVVAFKVNANLSNVKTKLKLYGNQKDMPVGESFEVNKNWTITFNAEVEPSTVTNNSIYVLDVNGNKVKDITLLTRGAKVEVQAPIIGYTSGETYTLHVTKAVKSSKSTILKKEETKTFKIK